MTAEQLIQEKHQDKLGLFGRTELENCMTEFAKYHVEQALKAASENVIIDGNKHEYELDKQSILNAYPLDNIK